MKGKNTLYTGYIEARWMRNPVNDHSGKPGQIRNKDDKINTTNQIQTLILTAKAYYYN